MESTVETSTFLGRPGAKHREVALLLALLGCMFALLALAGWHPSDPTLFSDVGGRVENPCGAVGAIVADLMLRLVGYGAWALFVPVATVAWRLAGRPLPRLGWWLALGGLYGTALPALHLIFADPDRVFPAGGMLGRLVGEALSAGLGPVGSGFALFAAALVFVTYVARIRWRGVFAWAVARVEDALPIVKQWTARGLVRLGSGARSSAVVVGQQVGRGVGSAGGATRSLFGGLSGAGRRMWESLWRREGDEEEWDTGLEDGPSEVSLLPGEEYAAEGQEEPSLGGDTVVADNQPRPLVEVEWEPTVDEASSHVLGLFPAIGPRASEPDVDEAPAVARDVELDEDDDRTAPSIDMLASPRVEEAPPSVVDIVDADPESEPEAAPVPIIAVQPAPAAIAPEKREAPPSPAPAPAAAPVAEVAVRSAAPGVKVEASRYLAAAVDDDGGALEDSSFPSYELPPLGLLDPVPQQNAAFDEDELRELARVLEEKLESFKITGEVVAVRPGPVVTILEYLPGPGVKVSRIAALQDDLAMALCAVRVRIVAPIPGKGVVGIEIPSQRRLTVFFREILASKEFRKAKAQLPVTLGKSVEGKPMVSDLAKMPHLLVGGTTGSGKSVGVNGMLLSLLYRLSPDELRLLLVDPKMLEFELYRDIPHLLHPIITDAKIAAAALAWACQEMDDRYALLARWGTRNIVSYNKKVVDELEDWTPKKARRYAPKGWPSEQTPPRPEKLPYIVIVIDELADLMMVASKDVEESIVRIAQKARACGIHLVVATQRPSVDVITGLIKANLPSRIAFQLRTRIDSRTVLDSGGAETLLGRGDMLFLPPGASELVRCHGAFIDDNEVARVCEHLRDQGPPQYIGELRVADEGDGGFDDDEDMDEFYDEAVAFVADKGKASTSMIQRKFRIGYNRAARIIDWMEREGVVGPADGSRPREVLVSPH